MDFGFIVELIEYWAEFPPDHLLLRGLVGYKGTGEVGRKSKQLDENADIKKVLTNKTGAKHVDCAPPHVQQAIERAKQGKHLEIPEPE